MLIRLGEYWGGWRVVPSAQSQARGHGEGGGVQYQADTRSQNSRTWGCLALLMSYDIFGILNLSEAGVSGNSRSQSFPRMEASDSLSRTLGMDFFIPFPFPNFGNGFFLFPSRSRISGMDFFHSLPVPELTLSKSGIKRENGRF